MKIALIVSLLVTSLVLNAQTFQGKVVRVVDGDTITILDKKREMKFVFGAPPTKLCRGIIGK